MGLSNDLISQFAKITNDTKVKQTESTIYGTVSILDGRPWVKFDGSDRLTPADTTAAVADGERVMVTVKNHTATITGNVSSPAARNKDVSELSGKIDEFDTVIADTVKAETAHIETAIITKLDGKYATFEGLDAKYASITSLEAAEADIDTLQANEIVINEKLTARDAEIDQLKANSLTVEVADAKYATIENLNGTNARFNNLESTYGEFKIATVGRLDAIEADIADLDVEKLDAKYATVTQLQAAEAEIDTLQANMLVADDLKALEADIADLQANKLSAKDADLKYATIAVLQSDYITAAEIAATYITASAVAAKYAEISTLESDYIKTTDLEANYITAAMINSKYAEIDLANVDRASIGTVLANIGLITSATIVDGHVTGYLDSVEVNANNITAGTLTVDRLIISGSDKSIIYAINNAGELTSTETDTIDGDVITKRTIAADHIIAGAITANEIHSSAVTADKIATNAVTADKIAANAITSGKIAANAITADKIAADSITADKINVVDLKALGATIGTFNIGDKSIYSGTKSTVSNTSRGIYMDTDGQLNFGDANNYLKFYKDQNNVYKLAIAAESLTFGASGTRIEDAFEEVQNSIDNVQANANSTNSANGSPVIINDSADGKVIDLKVYGKTEQFTTTGKNLCDPALLNGMSSNGGSNSYNASTYTITMNADATTDSTGRYCYPMIKVESGKRYTISFDIKGTPGKFVTCGWDLNRNNITLSANFTRYSKTLLATTTNRLPVVFYTNSTANGGLASGEYMQFANVQIEEGEVATEYEPYTGGIASPNPDYPQELVSIGDSGSFNVDVYGKNLLDLNSCIPTNKEKITISGDSVTIGPGSYIYGVYWENVSLEVGQTYTFSCGYLSQHGANYGFRLGYEDGTYSYSSSVLVTTTTITKPVKYVLFYVCYGETTTTDTIISNLQIEVGTQATEYESFKKQTLSLPYHLRGVKGVKDEIDFERGVYIQRFDKVVFNGSENWTANGSNQGYGLVMNNVGGDLTAGYASNVICDKLTASPQSNIYNGTRTNIIATRGDISKFYIRVDETITTVALLKSWLANNPVTAIYELATPNEIPLTEQVLSEYAKLRTYEPNTTLIADGSPEMYVEYFKNTEDGKRLAKNADNINDTISKVDVMYAQNTSSTTAPTSGWATTAPTWTDGKYIWSKTVTTYTNGTTSESTPVCITGAKGATGAAGVNGKSIGIFRSVYANSLAGIELWSTKTSDTWGMAQTPVDSSGQPLSVGDAFYASITCTDDGCDYAVLLYVRQAYSAGATSIPTKNASGYIKIGNKGATGSTGVGISSITELYYAGPSTTVPSAPTAAVTTNNASTYVTWNKAMPTYSASYPHYFTCSQVYYTNDTYKWTTPVYAGALTSANTTANTAATNAANALNTANNIQVGGRNYIVLSKLISHTPYNTIPTYSGKVITTTMKSSNTANYITLKVDGFEPEAGEIYTLSGYIKVNGEILSENFITSRATTYANTTDFASNKYDSTTGYFEMTLKYSGSWIIHATSKHVSGSAEVITFEKLKFEKGNKATDWTPAPEDVDAGISNAQTTAENAQSAANNAHATADTAQSTANAANTAAGNAQTTANTALGRVTIKDTRNDNRNPSWYQANYPRQIVQEFKYTSSIGLTGEQYCYLETTVQWGDSSGGYPRQVAKVGSKQYWRVGTSGTTWSAWNDPGATATNYMKFDSTNGLVVSQDATATGGNVQIKSDGFRIRNGTTVNASFLGNTITLGQNSSSSSINLCGDKGTIKINENQFGRDALTIMAEDVELYSDVSTSMLCKPGITSGGYSSTYSYCHTSYETFTLPNPITGSNVTFSFPVARIGAHGINSSDESVESQLEAGIGNVIIGGRFGSTDSMLGVSGTDGIQAYATGTPIKLAVYDSEIDPYIEVEPRTDTRGTRIYMAARNITLDPLDSVTINGAANVTGNITVPNVVRYNSVTSGGVTGSLAHISATDDLWLGYLSYEANVGTTIVAGKDVRIGTRSGFYYPYYKAGDSFKVHGIVGAQIYNDPQYLEFSVPLSKPIIGTPTMTLTTNHGVLVKMNGQCLYGSTWQSYSKAIQTLEIRKYDDNSLYLVVRMSNSTNAVANSSCAVCYSFYVTLS